jgi:hypothetical protein
MQLQPLIYSMTMTMLLWKGLKVVIVQKDDGSGKTLHHLAPRYKCCSKIHDRKINTEGKEDQQMQEILNMKGDKIQLTQKMFDLHKQDMEVRRKLKKEQLSINKHQLSLTKQDIKVMAKQSEAQLLTAEVGIMGENLEKLSPIVRSYYIMMQRQILERRGVIRPENNDGA